MPLPAEGGLRLNHLLRVLLVAALLAPSGACARPKTPPATAASTPEKRMPPTRETEEQFFARRPAGEPFELQVAGTAHESFWKKRRCAYTEWIFGSRENGVLASFTVAEKQGEELVLIDGGHEAPVGLRQVRLYLSPALERELSKGEADLPDELRRLADEGAINYLAEYCLEPGRPYHAVFREERYSLPPTGPGGEARTRTNKVLVLSDRLLVDGKPQGEPIPSYRNWSY